MKKKLLVYWRRLSKFSSVFIIIIMLNLLFSVYYIQHNHKKTILADKEKLIEQIGNSLEMLQYNPANNYDAIANITETEHLKVSITRKPVYLTQIDKDYLIHITNIMETPSKRYSFSVKVDNAYWVNYDYKERDYQALVQLSLLVIEITMAAILLVTLWFIERFRKPLKEFKKIAEQLGVGTPVETIDLSYAPSIIRETKDAMDKMQQRIVKLLNDRTRLLAAVSHDLRTPITRMKMRTQLHPHKNTLDNIRDLEEMSGMINQIILFSKEDTQGKEHTIFDLSSLLITICDEAIEMGQLIDVDIMQYAVAIRGEKLSIKRAISNILQNALKYGQHTWVTLTVLGARVMIMVEDDGPGIPVEELTQVFTPFYRISKYSEGNISGSGLGLAIVQDIFLAHKATMRLENREEGGLRVLMEFPLENMVQVSTDIRS